jgi:hypothetical protein
MWAYLEGGWYHYSGTQFFGGDPAPGWFVNGAIGTNNPNGWNFTIGGGYADSKKRSGIFSGPLATDTATPTPDTISPIAAATLQSENHYFLDFLAGRDVGLGVNDPPHLSFGLRVARFNHKASLTTTTLTITPGPSQTAAGSSRFLGYGPRISLKGSHPLGSAMSIDYGLGASYLYGKKDSSYSFNGTTLFTSSSKGWHANLDASLALGWQMSPAAKLGIGYRIEYWQGVLDSFDGATGAFHAQNRIAQGPFINLTVRF